MLLRIGRSSAAWETDDIEDICLRVFPAPGGAAGFDLAPSVYALDGEAQVVQAHAEHAAAAGNYFSNMRHFDVDNLALEVAAKDGDPAFRFIRSRHRELRFRDAQELRAVVARLKQSMADRAHHVKKKQLHEYVQRMLAQNDPEWLARCAARPDRARHWSGEATTAQAPPEGEPPT